MKKLKELVDRVIVHANVNLREAGFDAGPYVKDVVPWNKFKQFYAFYGLTSHHPLHFFFKDSNIAGSYFLGRVSVRDSLLYKTDVRGDELKCAADCIECGGLSVSLHEDEMIIIRDSYLIKNLVHNYCHDPENPEEFNIRNTVSMHFANIHGAPTEGSFLGPFATVDLTTVHNCAIGAYAYVQTGELRHAAVEPGRIWIKSKDFEFDYSHDGRSLKPYVSLEPGAPPSGVFMDFMEAHKHDFDEVYKGGYKHRAKVPKNSSLSRYARAKGEVEIGENVLVSQRAYLEDSRLGKGANAQENCYIIGSTLSGLDVTAHGGKIINAELGEKVFVGFNSFVRGPAPGGLKIGGGSVVMPHTIIDPAEPLEIPAGSLVWGMVKSVEDLKTHSLPLTELAAVKKSKKAGAMRFSGDGSKFVEAFSRRIDHILEANGAYFDGKKGRGHAQQNRDMSFATLQPFLDGPLTGLYPEIEIRP